ncbi:hypothetical protein HIM_04076 [Hirsutella minnesotensis 3608]|uniref:HMG box domain-containing protein n=1 Tax=Hirsutella minnesotensis 3608 TaxID=1043627 RepID=A0A0F7ZQ71_9HYPO|nr:hypothetical protein HIM_04076 [Hirsutella minnesotensis 3608]
MTRALDSIFAELGLSQYLNAFIDQGFDAWDTILDIQESDLDALGVKLGHRRKLQRRIANARGIAPSVSLAYTAKPSPEEVKQDGLRRESNRPEGSQENIGVQKRKYRRHPKPDENAPERPPSAYVLFSNKMREDLKSHNLTFTEIAKLVGENWQSLPTAEKESFESQANAAKEKYHQSLAEYKKTPEYRKYMNYLQDFKERQARQNKGHDSSKRPKLEPPRLRHGSTSSGVTPGGATSSGSRSGSSSERMQGSEPPPTRQERINSVASVAGSQHSSTAPTPMSYANSVDDGLSPRSPNFELSSPREPLPRHSRRQLAWTRRNRNASSQHHLPSLSDMLDDGKKMDTPMMDAHQFGPSIAGSGQSRMVSDGPTVRPPARVPLVHHESSSTGTNISRSSAGSFSRGHGEGHVPIHALLADRSTLAGNDLEKQPLGVAQAPAHFHSQRNPVPEYVPGPRGYGISPDLVAFRKLKVEYSGEGEALMSVDAAPGSSGKEGFDGMSALLRAGEIVGRDAPTRP